MNAAEKFSIALPAALVTIVRGEVASGQTASSSEVIRSVKGH
jgi:Arc/MetJ-type ribon-helix-helix transcriptional regulator